MVLRAKTKKGACPSFTGGYSFHCSYVSQPWRQSPVPAPSPLHLPEGPATPPEWELDESQFENISDSGGSDGQPRGPRDSWDSWCFQLFGVEILTVLSLFLRWKQDIWWPWGQGSAGWDRGYGGEVVRLSESLWIGVPFLNSGAELGHYWGCFQEDTFLSEEDSLTSKGAETGLGQ